MSPSLQNGQASVGVLVGVRIARRPAVLLQFRAAHDSYPGACQVTAHGKLTEEELKLPEEFAFPVALRRKLTEELGERVAKAVEDAAARRIELEREKNAKGRLVVTYGVDLGVETEDLEKLIVPGRDVGGFMTCTDPSKIQILEERHKTEGVPKKEIRMFRDEVAAVRKFFDRIFGQPEN